MTPFDPNEPGWEHFSWEVSSTDSATRIADEMGLADDDPRRAGKPSPRYDRRRGISIPPIRQEPPQVYGSLDGAWRTYNAAKFGRLVPDQRRPWELQRREVAG